MQREGNMNKLIALLLTAALCAAFHCSPVFAEQTNAQSGPSAQTATVQINAKAQVCFSPEGRCARAVIHAIQAAKKEILVQAYIFTSAPIAKALVEAHKRGIAVEVVLDKSQRKDAYSPADFVAHAGIPTYIDEQHAIAHNKIMIIDRETVITGSFNFTKNADEKNAENLLIIPDRELATVYLENYSFHRRHSGQYKGR
jgi:phosphatidylserine/phosphatidylglycerophosphate/cardiolipin synthase-like enzyme